MPSGLEIETLMRRRGLKDLKIRAEILEKENGIQWNMRKLFQFS